MLVEMFFINTAINIVNYYTDKNVRNFNYYLLYINQILRYGQRISDEDFTINFDC